MSEKCKSTSPSAIKVKMWQNTMSIEEKLHVISCLEKGERVANICCNVQKRIHYYWAIMLDSLMVVYVQFMIMLI